MKSIGLILVLAALAGSLGPQQRVIPRSPIPKPNLELRIILGKLERGLPKSFTFVFEYVSDHKLRCLFPLSAVTAVGLCHCGHGSSRCTRGAFPVAVEEFAAQVFLWEDQEFSNGQSFGKRWSKANR